MTDRHRRICWTGVTLLVALAVGSPCRAAEEKARLECGIYSLYVLLRLEGLGADYGSLRAALPVTNPAGHSMAELRDAAATFGLGLDGRQLARGVGAVDRPMIAYLGGGSKGHFVVIRPVGTTGSMVQVIDPPRSPWIGDLDQIATHKRWTGRVLVPSAVPTGRLATIGALALSSLAVFGLVARRVVVARQGGAIVGP